ncbi:hydroxyacylglutathione hydrolase [Nematocida sp. AWRm78]|nr:hydroxyacylglutathione hydrolase [Nematocida sp. AWRm79]KAI5187137.1 hydroxyacylglutathione hydrolase [Nematocida sp. AWRm78]
MQIIPIGARETNLMYIIVGPQNELVFVDPVEPMKIEKEAEQFLATPETKIAVLTTHHHEDHSAGNAKIKRMHPTADIYAGSSQSYATHICKDGDVISIGALRIECMHIPCHTQDSFAYAVYDTTSKESAAVFVGDTLFYLGCGIFFEGTAEMMHSALKKISSLPSDTVVYYGHEYKESNMQFRRVLIPDPEDLCSSERIFLTVGEEKKHNFYMNTSLVEKRKEFSGKSPTEIIHTLRQMKNAYNSQK